MTMTDTQEESTYTTAEARMLRFLRLGQYLTIYRSMTTPAEFFDFTEHTLCYKWELVRLTMRCFELFGLEPDPHVLRLPPSLVQNYLVRILPNDELLQDLFAAMDAGMEPTFSGLRVWIDEWKERHAVPVPSPRATQLPLAIPAFLDALRVAAPAPTAEPAPVALPRALAVTTSLRETLDLLKELHVQVGMAVQHLADLLPPEVDD